ncbi:hypothetical protein NQ317_003907 [Molorchus minor]|uniref:Phosphoglucomutase-2 n=1 Tax=Molorchus minor TaxID=1323400 RepID=A0ABQ9IY27_9CUCU|nr:hypothetical protein NQ317_003907 [Molorchus minor]
MCPKTGHTELDQKVEEWLSWDKNKGTSNALKRLVADSEIDQLKKILLNRISFGTAGLRGKMDVGYACMNDLVIIQTAQGFLKWALLTTTVFVNAGYPVRLFSEVIPTPFIPFAVVKYKSASGVMVTASHNPKDDNGYKVYGSNGAQIVSPADKNIQKHILQNLEPLETSWDIGVLTKSDLVTDPLPAVLKHYLQNIGESILPEHKQINQKAEILFTYTAMHGVGYQYIQKGCDMIGIRIAPVLEQRDPDPEFRTIPKSEEGKSSLDLSFKTANENGSRVIIANDPDADRMAAAEKNPNTDEWKVFTGNELGALLGWWMLHCFKIKNPTEPLSNVYMISSTVSSMILRSNEVLKLQKTREEQAIGFMCSTDVLDKDGVSAAMHFATMASFLYDRGQTLVEKLEQIYEAYGQHVSCNSYYICHDPVKISKIFNRIRNISGENTYPSGILNNKYQITSIRDLTTGYDSSQVNNKAVLPVSKSSQMITFNFSNGLVCTLRTSGTEPKIKYYTEYCASPHIKDKKGYRRHPKGNGRSHMPRVSSTNRE